MQDDPAISNLTADQADRLQAALDSITKVATELQRATDRSVDQPRMGENYVWSGMAVVGVLLGAAAVLFFARFRQKAYALLGSIIAGGFTSSVVGALGSRIAGIGFRLTVAEASLFILTWFAIGVFISLVLGYYWIDRKFVAPLVRKYGPLTGARTWAEFWAGPEMFQKWIERTTRMEDADPAWDQFACATRVLHDEMGNNLPIELSAFSLSALSSKPGVHGDVQNEVNAIRTLRDVLGPPIESFCARLDLTTFNFTVWRISRSNSTLEHLVSIPMDHGHESGHGHPAPLPMFGPQGRSQAGCLAAKALMDGVYRSLSPDCPGEAHWPARQLGSSYDSVGAMPVPCDGTNQSPWAVVCVERRGGTIPVSSHAVRLVVGALANAVNVLEPFVHERSLSDILSSPSIPSVETKGGE